MLGWLAVEVRLVLGQLAAEVGLVLGWLAAEVWDGVRPVSS